MPSQPGSCKKIADAKVVHFPIKFPGTEHGWTGRQAMATGLAGAAAFLFRQRLYAAPKMQLVETEDDIEGSFYKPDAPETIRAIRRRSIR